MHQGFSVQDQTVATRRLASCMGSRTTTPAIARTSALRGSQPNAPRKDSCSDKRFSLFGADGGEEVGSCSSTLLPDARSAFEQKVAGTTCAIYEAASGLDMLRAGGLPVLRGWFSVVGLHIVNSSAAQSPNLQSRECQ